MYKLESKGLLIQDLKHKAVLTICGDIADDYHSIMVKLGILHLSASFVAFYKEVYEANM